jgi:zinc/manganese transport system permease protein
MSEATRFFTVQIALLAIVLVLHTYLGLHVIRRSLIFSDLVLDQLAAFGALVGIGLAIRYGSPASYLMSLVAVLVGALLLAVLKPRNPMIPREATIGFLYAMALVASLLLGDKLVGGGAYVTKTLAGSMLWVSWPIVGVTAAVYVVLLVFHYVYRHQFIALAEREGSLPREKLWDFLFFATQGVITVLIVPVAGVLLAYAFLMIPAAIAAMFTRRWGPAVLLGWGLGLTACLIGLYLSYFHDLPYGPTLILALGAFFAAALVVRVWLPQP